MMTRKEYNLSILKYSFENKIPICELATLSRNIFGTCYIREFIVLNMDDAYIEFKFMNVYGVVKGEIITKSPWNSSRLTKVTIDEFLEGKTNLFVPFYDLLEYAISKQ